MGKKLAIEHHLIRQNEVIELLEMMGGKNKDNADGCSFLYYTLCTPKTNNPNNEKVICGFTNLKMQNDFFAIFTLEKFWEKYPYKLNDTVLCDDGLLGVVTKMEWDCEKSDMKYHISFKIPVDNKWYSSKNIKCKFMEAKGKKLAIKGHPTRGHEVIELLKIMGGKICAFDYDSDGYAYYIDTSNMIICSNENTIKQNLDKYQLFTLEEFWEKYPFKVGDKVIDEADGCPGVVCEMKWDEGLSDMKYCVAFGNGIDFGWFANDSINYFKIKKDENLEESQSNQDIDKDVFRKEFCERCGSQRCSGQDDELVYCERFKNLMDNSGKPSVENHKMGPKSKLPSKYYEVSMEETQSKREYDELRMPLDDDDKLATEATIMGKKILPPDGYLVGKITQTDNGMLVEYVEKKPKYPTTYAECCEVLVGRKPKPNEISFDKMKLCLVDLDNTQIIDFQNPYLSQLNSLFRLRMCCDAYWKIAGEKMGLDKPWEPDLENEELYCIQNYNKQITISRTNTAFNKILIFPTEEMRDAFYENFKKEIEQCKELL